MSNEALLLLSIFCMIGVLILEVRKLRKVFDTHIRNMYIKSALDSLDEREE